MADATVTIPTPLPLVPADAAGASPGWIIKVARAINGLLRGRDSSTMTVTLAANAVTSNVYDARISLNTFFGLVPNTATAATAFASGSFYVTLATGTATIHHPSTADTDKTFIACLRG